MYLNPESPIPLHYQLKEQLRGEILAGRVKVGDRLPPERDLAHRYGVSRMTARQALQSLVHEGYLSRQSGRGTFVTAPSAAIRISSKGFSEDMAAMGMRPTSKVLSATVEPAVSMVAYDLRITAGAPCFRLERLRFADGEPMAYELSYLSADRFPDLASQDFTNRSLYQFLNEKYGVYRTRSRRTVESVGASVREAELLAVPVGTPMLKIAGIALDNTENPLETGWTVYRADRFKLSINEY